MPDVHASSRLRGHLASHGIAEGLIIVVLLGWHLLSLGMPDFVLPGPLPVAIRILELFTDTTYFVHVASSAVRVVLAVLMAVALGSLLAFLSRWLPITEIIVHGRIKPLLNAFPSVGWAILAIIWFGPSNGTIVFIMITRKSSGCTVRGVVNGMCAERTETIRFGAGRAEPNFARAAEVSSWTPPAITGGESLAGSMVGLSPRDDIETYDDEFSIKFSKIKKLENDER